MRSSTGLRLGVLLAAVGITAGTSALASVPDWDGQTIGVEYLSPDLFSPDVDYGGLVVGPGAEGFYHPFFPLFDFDLSASQIVMSFAYGLEGGFGSVDFTGPHFYDYLASAPDLTGVSINGATTMGGLDMGDVTWGADDVFVNFQGLSFFPGTQVVLDLHFDGEQNVPEASTWAAGAALAALGGGMWLRRRRA